MESSIFFSNQQKDLEFLLVSPSSLITHPPLPINKKKAKGRPIYESVFIIRVTNIDEALVWLSRRNIPTISIDRELMEIITEAGVYSNTIRMLRYNYELTMTWCKDVVLLVYEERREPREPIEKRKPGRKKRNTTEITNDQNAIH